MCNKIFLGNFSQKVVVHIFTLLLAPFVSKLVMYSRHSESLNILKNSESDNIFLHKFFKDSLCLQKFTNLDTQGAKRSVKLWATNFYNFFLNRYVVVQKRSAVKNYVWSKIGFVHLLWAASNRPLRATWAKTAAPTWFAAKLRYGCWSTLNEASFSVFTKCQIKA